MENEISFEFEGMPLRKAFSNGEWWFSVIDIVAILTESKQPKAYWGKMKEREPQLLTICQQLPLSAQDGKNRKTDVVTFKAALRLLQSIPSKKAEPLKLALAELASQKIEEIADPSLAIERAIQNYEKRGRSEAWIKERLTGIGTRKRITDEWRDRGLGDLPKPKQGPRYAQLTNTVHGCFELKTSEHLAYKNLKSHNLRDHMTTEELSIIGLTETTCRALHVKNSSHGFDELKDDAEKAADFGKETRLRMEQLLGQKIVSRSNFLKGKRAVKAISETL